MGFLFCFLYFIGQKNIEGKFSHSDFLIHTFFIFSSFFPIVTKKMFLFHCSCCQERARKVMQDRMALGGAQEHKGGERKGIFTCRLTILVRNGRGSSWYGWD